MISFRQMRSRLLIYSGIFVLLLASYGIFQYVYANIIPGTGSLMITSTPESQVYLDDNNSGNTTYQKKGLKSGEYKIRLEAQSSSSANPTLIPLKKVWETKIKVSVGSQVLVNRELGPSNELGSGEILTLEKGSGLVISTNPENADIVLDDQKLGPSPLEKSVESGLHKVTVSKEGYISRMLEVNVTNGFKLIINVDLTPQVKIESKELKAYKNLRVIHIYPTAKLNQVGALAEMIDLEMYKADLLMTEDGILLTQKELAEKIVKENPNPTLAYLAEEQTADLGEAAKKSIDDLRLSALGNKANTMFLEVTTTPTGYLNVREGPSTSAKLITRIKPGEKFELLEEHPEWFKIQLPDSTSGWVSAQYVTKVQP